MTDGHHHHHEDDDKGLGDYAREFFTNWNESDLPTANKVYLTFRNRGRAFLRTVGPPFTGCCGHYGEPGC